MSDGGLLALDLSTHVGWAFGRPGDRPRFGTWLLPSMAEPGRCGAALERALADAITVLAPTRIVVEAPLPLPAQTNMATARLQLGLALVVQMVAYWRDLPAPQEVRADQARMGVLGRARFGGRDEAKQAVLRWCRLQDWKVEDDNAGDALVLWRWGCISEGTK